MIVSRCRGIGPPSSGIVLGTVFVGCRSLSTSNDIHICRNQKLKRAEKLMGGLGGEKVPDMYFIYRHICREYLFIYLSIKIDRKIYIYMCVCVYIHT